MEKMHPTGIVWIWTIQIFCFALAYIAISNRSRIMVLEKKERERHEVTMIIKDAKDVGFVVRKDEQGRVYLYLPE